MKRFVAITLALISIWGVALFATACDEDTRNFPPNELRYVDESDAWYSATKFSFSDTDIGLGDSWISSPIVITHNDWFSLLIGGVDISSNYENVYKIYRYTYDGELLSTIDLVEETDSADMGLNIIGSYRIGECDYYILETYSYTDYIKSTDIYKTNYDNSTLIHTESLDTSNLLTGASYEGRVAVTDKYIVLPLTDSDNNKYLYSRDILSGTSALYPISLEDSDEWFILDNYSSSHSYGWNDTIYYKVLCSDSDAIYEFNPSDGDFKKVRTLEFGEKSPRYIGPDGAFFYIDDAKVYAADVVTNEDITIIANLKYSPISPNCYNPEILDYCNGNLIIRGDDCIYAISKDNTNPHAGKQILSLAYLGNIDDAVSYLVENYNSSDSEFFLELTPEYNAYSLLDYGEWESVNEAYSVASNKLIRDINNGVGPDIVIGGSGCASTNPSLIYADLTEYVTGTDGLNSDDYLSAVFTACASDDGLYSIPYALSLSGIAIDKSQYSGSSMNFEDYVSFINEHHRGFDIISDLDSELSDIEYFNMLFAACFDDFVSNGKFNITTEDSGNEFESLARFVSDRDTQFFSDGDSSIRARTINSHSFIQYLYDVEGKSYTVIGLPTYSGSSANTDVNYTVSITGCCANKDAAWSVVSKLFEYDLQVTLINNIPVNIGALNSVCDRTIDGVSSQELYVEWYRDTIDLEAFKADFIAAVSSINHSTSADPFVVQIINEELPAFFEGQKNLDDVAEIIENRVETYLDEIR